MGRTWQQAGPNGPWMLYDNGKYVASVVSHVRPFRRVGYTVTVQNARLEADFRSVGEAMRCAEWVLEVGLDSLCVTRDPCEYYKRRVMELEMEK